MYSNALPENDAPAVHTGNRRGREQMNAHKSLVCVLRLVAAHSLAAGLALILMPDDMAELFFPAGETGGFFRVQGGVFHLVLVVAYWIASTSVESHAGLLQLSVIAKAIATVFLLAYYFAVDALWIVLLSGVGDAAMGFAIYFLWKRLPAPDTKPVPGTIVPARSTEAP